MTGVTGPGWRSRLSPRSLRARLILGLLAVAAIGMLLVAVIAYAEQRRFLYDKVDAQTRGVVPFAGVALNDAAHGGPSTGSGSSGDGVDDGMGPREGYDGDGPPPDRRGRGGNELPPGTYAELRDDSGRTVSQILVTYGSSGIVIVRGTTDTLPSPRLPRSLSPGRDLTVDARDKDDDRFRVHTAIDRRTGGLLVVAVPLGSTDATLGRLLLVEALVVGGVLLLLGIGGWFLVRLGLRPLDDMGRTAGEIAHGDLDRRVDPAEPTTEVGRLGLAINGMLARLEVAFAEKDASEERLRAFLADASHELRTPLASIRGYAELFRLGAITDPDELRRAMQRIEEESSRMGVLVEDLLVLARLDEAREQERAAVDLARLAGDAVDDARATEPERPIDLQAVPDAVVAGSEDQLRQVLGNLVRNALVHTPPGTRVEVVVDRAGDDVVLEVRDHGPGLPDASSAALFERFWRAEGGRERGKSGAGLGLSIVAEIVEQHGGRVHAANAAGGGARFVVRLPAVRLSNPTGSSDGAPTPGPQHAVHAQPTRR